MAPRADQLSSGSDAGDDRGKPHDEEQLRARIVKTRAALGRDLDELGRRLSEELSRSGGYLLGEVQDAVRATRRAAREGVRATRDEAVQAARDLPDALRGRPGDRS